MWSSLLPGGIQTAGARQTALDFGAQEFVDLECCLYVARNHGQQCCNRQRANRGALTSWLRSFTLCSESCINCIRREFAAIYSRTS